MTYTRTAKLRRPGRKSSSRRRPICEWPSQKIETRGDRINEPVGNLDATALFCNVIPDVEEFGFRFW